MAAGAPPCTTLSAPLHIRHHHPSLCNHWSVCNDFQLTKRYTSCFKLEYDTPHTFSDALLDTLHCLSRLYYSVLLLAVEQ